MPEYVRCFDCVKGGKFKVTNPDKFWEGWPKDPKQILYERGWVPTPVPPDYDDVWFGTKTLEMPDYELLLTNYRAVGHYGYGGLSEGLCCMPGCHVEDSAENPLKQCAKCRTAKYCCAEHQKLDWKQHKKTCRQISNGCARCKSKTQVRYGTCTMPPNGEKGTICGKCAINLGLQLSDWVYPQHPRMNS